MSVLVQFVSLNVVFLVISRVSVIVSTFFIDQHDCNLTFSYKCYMFLNSQVMIRNIIIWLQ